MIDKAGEGNFSRKENIKKRSNKSSILWRLRKFEGGLKSILEKLTTVEY